MSHAGIDLESARILVTGAGGFIGRHLARQLAVAGADVVALMRSTSNRGDLERHGVVFSDGDLRDPESLVRAAADVDVVFHLAGLTRARRRAEFMDVNGEGTARLARAAAESGRLRRFVYVSSLAAAGPNPDGVVALDESMVARPASDYGASKLAGETRLRETLGDDDWTIVRPPIVYGPGERDLLNVFRLVKRGFSPLAGRHPKSYSFVYVDDLVEATLRLASHAAAAGEVFFTAEPAPHTDLELHRAIEAGVGRKARAPRLPLFVPKLLAAAGAVGMRFTGRVPLVNRDRVRELAADRIVCSSDKLRERIGYTCPTALDDGIVQTARWYFTQGWI